MGLLSLDILSLEVLKRGGKPHEQVRPKTMLPNVAVTPPSLPSPPSGTLAASCTW